MLSEQWKDSPAGRKMIVPFDEVAWQKSINRLGKEIATWMKLHQDRHFISFVDNADHTPSTHQEMLRVAEAQSGIKIEHYLKKPVARKTPYGYIRSVLEARGARFDKVVIERNRLERASSREQSKRLASVEL
jgi:hypothetical protein